MTSNVYNIICNMMLLYGFFPFYITVPFLNEIGICGCGWIPSVYES
jgi:hypothetical protein